MCRIRFRHAPIAHRGKQKGKKGKEGKNVFAFFALFAFFASP
jgi:hypothetical protein